jgi:hypothetical protein
VTATDGFEVLRFDAAPVTEDVAVVELEGRWRRGGPGPERHPRLIVEAEAAERLELPALAAGGDADRWHASFAVPARDGASYALGLRGVRLELPAPDERADGERLVTLARELNAVRRRLDAATDETGRRLAEAERIAGERDAVAEQRVSAAEERARAAEQRAGEAQETSIRLRTELEQARQAQALRDAEAQAGATALRESLESVREDNRELRRALKQARAELEAARRERARPAPPAEPDRLHAEAPTAVATGDREHAPLPHADGGVDGDVDVDVNGDAATLVGVPSPGGAAASPDATPAPHDDDALDSVRIIGRERRRTLADAVPPTTAELDPPPTARWIAVGALLAVAFVLLLVVIFSLWL